MGWWSTKVRQTVRHVGGRVRPEERSALEAWLAPAQAALFGSMHRADQRHGLDVVAALRSSGHDDPELLLAGLFHDCAKGPGIELRHRVAWALGERHPELRGSFTRLPGFEAAFERLADHPARSADLARVAGCSERTAELIRRMGDPGAGGEGRALRLADDAS